MIRYDVTGVRSWPGLASLEQGQAIGPRGLDGKPEINRDFGAESRSSRFLLQFIPPQRPAGQGGMETVDRQG